MEKCWSTMYDAITQGMEDRISRIMWPSALRHRNDAVTTILYKDYVQDIRRR